MKEALSNFIAARLELASIEAKEAAGLLGKKALYGVVLAISAFFCWALLLAGITGVVAPHASEWLAGKADWLPGWAAVILALGILHAIVAVICLCCLRKKPTTPLFELSRKEIENDKEWLKQNK